MNTSRFKTWALRLAGGLAGLVLLALFGVWVFLRSSLAQLDGQVAASGLQGDVVVTRDAQGVPTISGENRNDVAYATGYVHGQERFFQMDLTRRSGAGELAELFGSKALPTDRQRRLHRFRARAAEAIATMPPDERVFLERYAAGVNDGLAALAANPFEYALIGVKPRPWEAADCLLVVWAMFFDLQGNQEPRELARGWLKEHATAEQLAFLLPQSTEWDAPLDAPAMPSEATAIPATAPAWWGRRNQGETSVAASDVFEGVGSNNWAISGKRTADGAAIVSDDMHLGIRLPNTWFRVVLQFPDKKVGTRRVVGVTLPGAAPLVVVGSNGEVAWGFTNSYGDFMDLVALGRDDAHPGMLRTPTGWETPVSVEETILVKGMSPKKLVVQSVSLGPVREAGGRAYAVHWTAHRSDAVNASAIKTETASTVAEVLAVAGSAGIPAQNYVVGDRLGNIGWTVGGLLPRRAQPGVASTFPLMDDNAAAGWDGVLAANEHPKIMNPTGGQIVTANSRQLMGAGADLIGDGGFDLGARTRQARDSLAGVQGKVGINAAYSVMLDDRALFMAPWRERAIKALDARAVDRQPLRAEFLAHLKNGWTGRASVNSVGYHLTRNYMWALQDILYGGANEEIRLLDERATVAMASTRWPVVVARLIDTQAAGWLPPGYKDWQDVQLVAIDRVIATAVRETGTLSAATWGSRNTAAIEHPIAKAAPMLRAFLSAPADMLPGDTNMPRVSNKASGQSERMTVAPGKEEQGIFNMPGGQSGHPMSPFFLNGHADWVSGKPTPLLPGAPRHRLVFSARQ